MRVLPLPIALHLVCASLLLTRQQRPTTNDVSRSLTDRCDGRLMRRLPFNGVCACKLARLLLTADLAPRAAGEMKRFCLEGQNAQKKQRRAPTPIIHHEELAAFGDEEEKGRVRRCGEARLPSRPEAHAALSSCASEGHPAHPGGWFRPNTHDPSNLRGAQAR